MMQPRRAGAALVLALLVVLVLECVIVGTLHLTRVERRLADNGTLALRLRLAAEHGARAAAGVWPALLDSIPFGDVLPAISSTHGGLIGSAHYQRVDSSLVLVVAEAHEPAPRYGVAHAALLLEPPLLRPEILPRSALATDAAVQVRAGAVIAPPDPSCNDPSSASAVQLPLLNLLQLDPGASIGGSIDVAALAADWPARIRAVAAFLPAHTAVDSTGRVVYAGNGSDVIAVLGDVVIPTNTRVRGMVLVAGNLLVETGAQIDGIVIVSGDVDVRGRLRFSSCAADAAIRQKSLHRPRPHARRASLPGF